MGSAPSKYAHSDDGGWTGGDSTYVRRLPDGRHVMMFSDTFLGQVRADGARTREIPPERGQRRTRTRLGRPTAR
ncbi:hypothetical protein [Nocardia thraciensis]